MVWSDHSIVIMSFVSQFVNPSKIFHWKLNEALLSDPAVKSEVEIAISDYFSLNDTDDISAESLWAAHKVTVRGRLIQISSQLKKSKRLEVENLERSFSSLQKAHKKNHTHVPIALLDKAPLDLNLALNASAEKHIRWSGARYYHQRDKMGPLLASKILPRPGICN